MRKIVHIDMDAFFASVEQRDVPKYRGKPIAVGGTPEQRGVVATASYEARQYGIHSAMPSRVARQRCPNIIFVPPRFDTYKTVSQHIHRIFHRYTDLIEPLSLDEAYLDVTTNKPNIPSATEIARRIRRDIHRETHLTASAGISINKFLAKIASGIEKPNGLYTIPPEQAVAFVEDLAIDRFFGIGPATATKMHSIGVKTGADLKNLTLEQLTDHFGKRGTYYYTIARAQDNRPVQPNRVRKSIGVERSFAKDLSDRPAIREVLTRLAEELQTRLERHHRWGRTLTLKVKYSDYEQITRSNTHTEPIREKNSILKIAYELLEQTAVATRSVRLLGLTISNLEEVGKLPQQLPLAFDALS